MTDTELLENIISGYFYYDGKNVCVGYLGDMRIDDDIHDIVKAHLERIDASALRK